MAELIALEWDANEVRLAVAKTYGSAIHVERLESVALGAAEDPSERLQEAIAKRNAEQVDLLKEISSNTADRQNGTF